MILVLQDSVTSAPIGEMEADFVPAVGDTFIYHEGETDEAVYTVTKRLYPTLMRDGVKVIRLRVRPAEV
jgi:hypothetical protein